MEGGAEFLTTCNKEVLTRQGIPFLNGRYFCGLKFFSELVYVIFIVSP